MVGGFVLLQRNNAIDLEHFTSITALKMMKTWWQTKSVKTLDAWLLCAFVHAICIRCNNLENLLDVDDLGSCHVGMFSGLPTNSTNMQISFKDRTCYRELVNGYKKMNGEVYMSYQKMMFSKPKPGVCFCCQKMISSAATV